ncbi:M16 family metallopeptidase [Leucothrix pacifica]|uniref:Peptidase M16 n=1 Tax=Leucothrix pacifica TaxID=1247513 RepID=A0A317CMA4_9GAMM|nr:pitrilysin family protein [Leucothrix pacifica]PWQ99449.1 peptidase M16 [Leucothrix pacifica]
MRVFQKLAASCLVATIALLSTNALAGPKIENWTTDTGLRVFYVGIDDLPMLDLSLSFDAGSARDGEQYGVASMTMAMMDKGAAGMDANKLAEVFENVGANFYTNASRDMANIGLRTITLEKPFKSAVDNWLAVIESPEFPQADFERMQKQKKVGFEAQKQNPGSIAGREFYKHLYGDHPYANPVGGYEDSIAAMTTADLKAFYERYIVEENAMLTITGNVNREEAELLAKRIAEVLPAGKKPEPIPEVKPLTEAKTIHIPFPSSQAHILMGQPGYKRGDKDYFKLYLANHPFGGSGFTSRLMKEIRVKRGLSYSVYSYFSPSRELGPFVMGMQTKLDQIDEGKEALAELLNTYLKDGATEAEIEESKLNITGGFPMGVAGNSNIGNYAEMIGFYGMPLNYLDTFTDRINAVTLDEAKEAMQRRIKPDAMLTVVVGGEAKTDDSAEASKDETAAGSKKTEAVSG